MVDIMNRTQRFGIILTTALLLLVDSTSNASVRLPTRSNGNQRTIVLKLSDLRSAYLLRSGAARYDPSQMSAKGIRSQLQRHFNTVLGLLLISTPRSIEAALDRLEADTGERWSADERAARRQQLLTNRYLQMK